MEGLLIAIAIAIVLNTIKSDNIFTISFLASQRSSPAFRSYNIKKVKREKTKTLRIFPLKKNNFRKVKRRRKIFLSPPFFLGGGEGQNLVAQRESIKKKGEKNGEEFSLLQLVHIYCLSSIFKINCIFVMASFIREKS